MGTIRNSDARNKTRKMNILCIDCQKIVAKGTIKGITTWFAICSECKFNVKGWKNE